MRKQGNDNEQFALDLAKALQDFADKKNLTISIEEVNKNNDTIKKAINVTREGEDIGKVIYIDSFFKDYCEGESSIEDIVNSIAEIINEDKNPVQEKCKELVAKVYDYNQIKDNLIVKLINLQKNKEYLKDKIYKEWLDFAICLYAKVKEADDDGIASMAIPNKMLLVWGREKDEVIEEALKNCETMLPAKIINMEDVIIEMILDVKEDSFEQHMNPPASESNLWVLSNNQRVNGATAVLYKNVLKEFAEEKNVEEVYIIPSSVHEVILVPISDKCNMTYEMLNEMIVEVNAEEVEPEEVLGNHAYIYNREKDDIYFI